MKAKHDKLIEFIKKRRGFACYADLVKSGFYKALINDAIDSGQIERLSRGVYSLAENTDLSHPDLVAVSVIVPKGVICLISALSFHEVTDEIPHYIDVAIPARSRVRRIKNIPIRYYRFSQKTWEAGIEEHDIDGHKIKVFSLAKTIADCFRFRNQVGMDVARSALKSAFEERKVSHRDIMKYASICRVTKIVKPILETLL